MNHNEIENIEIDLVLEAIHKRSGYDFRQYARSSIERRIRRFAADIGSECISGIIPAIIHDEKSFSTFIQFLSISVTEMFRDPQVYSAVREEVVPILRTWHHLRVWHAGCATGEEAYSLAIILLEEGILDRTTIFATDFNDAVLEKASLGIYSPDTMREATQNYQRSGGKASFGDYYHARYDAATMHRILKDRITFANHNLTIDGVFGEMHLIFCRNVLIYFNLELQNRVLRLFADSLVRNGFLCLGTKESIEFTDVRDEFTVINEKAGIYKKKDIN